MAQETKQADVSSANVIQGDGADLAAALADTQGESRGKISFADPGEEQAPKPEKKPEKKPQATQVETDDDEGSGSGILDAMAALSAEQSEAGGDDGTPDADNKGKKGEPGEKGEEVSHDVEGVEEVDTNIPVGPAIREKFKRFKANEKALKAAHSESTRLLNETSDRVKTLEAELAQARESAPSQFQDSEEFKTLERRAREAEELVERLRLEESPRFKDKFDNKIAKEVQSVQPFLKAITDPDKFKATVAELDAAAAIAPGEDNDPAFYGAISKITEGEDFPAHLKAPVFTKLVNLRQLINDRHAAISDWKETAKENGSLDLQGVRQRTEDAGTVLKQIISGYQQKNKARLEIYNRPDVKEVIDYEGETSPYVQLLESELGKSVESGGPSPNLIALAHQGAELPFQVKMNQQMSGVVKDLQAENEKLKSQVAKLKGGGTSGGSGGGTASTTGSKTEDDPAKYRKGSGILATMDELASAE